MFSRALLRSAAVTAIVIGTGSPALAQKSAVLEPASSWAVTSVETDTGSGAYCAMARRFKDGVIMTVAKNNKNETSLAMDFSTAEFNPAESVAVVLDPGAGEQRNYDLKPVSKKAFVVRLGADDKFFTALERTGFLRAEVGKQSYYFNLADIDKGNRQLDGCLYSMASPAAGDYGGMTPMPGEGNVLPGGGAQFTARMDALEKENEGLRIQLAQAQGVKKEPLMIDPFPDTASSPDQNATAEDLRTEVAKLRRDNADLIASINVNRSGGGGMDGDKAELLRRVSVLEEENRKLAMAGGASASVKSLETENERLRAALAVGATLSSDTQFLTGQAAEVFGSRIASLREENERLSKTCMTQTGQAPQTEPSAPPEPLIAPASIESEGPVAPMQKSDVLPQELNPSPPLPSRKPEIPKERMYGILPAEQKIFVPEEKSADLTDDADDNLQSIYNLVRPEDIDEVLRAAGLTPSDPVVKAELSGAFGHMPVYRWSVDGVPGSAEQRIMGSQGFDEAVHEYIQAYQERCGGTDFAVEANSDHEAGGVRVASLDVVCIGAGVDRSAAMLFTLQDGVLTVISHETPSEHLALAMETRDTLGRRIGSGF